MQKEQRGLMLRSAMLRRNTQSSGRLMGLAFLMTGCITVAHYITDSHDVAYHNVFRRLYYVPVVLAAFGMGLRGGLGAALVASLAYVPHAFFLEHHHDPAPTIDKVGEIVLYLVVGAMTGWLVEKEHRARLKLERTLAERAELERELVRAGKLSALGELLAGIAHEVRNPLASILGAAEGLQRHITEEGRARRLVELQLRELERLQRVVSNFLSFARTGSIKWEVFDVQKLVEEIIDLTQHQHDQGTFELSPELEGATMYADRDQIAQIVLNLTLNAIQCRGNTPFVITFLYRQRDIAGHPHDGLGVRDEGVGVEEEMREKIFEPFITTRDSGAGLGLSLSSRIAQAHQGFLELDATDDDTTFWLYLPQQEHHS